MHFERFKFRDFIKRVVFANFSQKRCVYRTPIRSKHIVSDYEEVKREICEIFTRSALEHDDIESRSSFSLVSDFSALSRSLSLKDCKKLDRFVSTHPFLSHEDKRDILTSLNCPISSTLLVRPLLKLPPQIPVKLILKRDSRLEICLFVDMKVSPVPEKMQAFYLYQEEDLWIGVVDKFKKNDHVAIITATVYRIFGEGRKKVDKTPTPHPRLSYSISPII